jgi:RNA polymerase sigma factor (sigma-70 family)
MAISSEMALDISASFQAHGRNVASKVNHHFRAPTLGLEIEVSDEPQAAPAGSNALHDNARPASADLYAYIPALKRYFRRRAAVAEVDDLTQEVLLNMHSRRSLDSIDNLQAYVFSVAANVLARHHSRRRVERVISFGEDPYSQDLQFAQVPSAEDEVLMGEKLNRFVIALEALSPRARDVFVLHRFDDMSYEAIAHRLNISVSAIEKHIMNALKAIRAKVDGDS